MVEILKLGLVKILNFKFSGNTEIGPGSEDEI